MSDGGRHCGADRKACLLALSVESALGPRGEEGVEMPAFTVSDAARPKIEALLEEAGEQGSYLRVSIDAVK